MGTKYFGQAYDQLKQVMEIMKNMSPVQARSHFDIYPGQNSLCSLTGIHIDSPGHPPSEAVPYDRGIWKFVKYQDTNKGEAPKIK